MTAPYLDFYIKKGDRIGWCIRDGEIFTGIVTNVTEDKETGEVRITLE